MTCSEASDVYIVDTFCQNYIAQSVLMLNFKYEYSVCCTATAVFCLEFSHKVKLSVKDTEVGEEQAKRLSDSGELRRKSSRLLT